MIKPFMCYYYRSYGYGAYDDIMCITTANTESEALGLVLQYYPETQATYWGIGETDCSTIGVEHISNNSN